MQPKSRTQQLARDLYLHTDKSQQEIADILDVNRKTVYLWIKHGRWQEMEAAADQAPARFVNHFINQVHEINNNISKRPVGERCPTMVEARIQEKLFKLMNQVHAPYFGYYVQVCEELVKYMMRANAQVTRMAMPFIDQFIQGLINDWEGDLNHHQKLNVDRIFRNLAEDEAEETTRQKEYEKEYEAATRNKSDANPREEKPTNSAFSSCEKQGTNGAMWGNDGAMGSPMGIRPEPAMVNDSIKNRAMPLPQNVPEKIVAENGALPQETPTAIPSKSPATERKFIYNPADKSTTLTHVERQGNVNPTESGNINASATPESDHNSG